MLYLSSWKLCKWHSCLTQVSPARPCSAVIHAQRPLLALTLGFGHPLPPAAYLRSGLSYVAPIARHEEKMLFLCLDPGTLAHQQIFGVDPKFPETGGVLRPRFSGFFLRRGWGEVAEEFPELELPRILQDFCCRGIIGRWDSPRIFSKSGFDLPRPRWRPTFGRGFTL